VFSSIGTCPAIALAAADPPIDEKIEHLCVLCGSAVNLILRKIVYVKKPECPARKSGDETNVNFFLNTVILEVSCQLGSFLNNES